MCRASLRGGFHGAVIFKELSADLAEEQLSGRKKALSPQQRWARGRSRQRTRRLEATCVRHGLRGMHGGVSEMLSWWGDSGEIHCTLCRCLSF